MATLCEFMWWAPYLEPPPSKHVRSIKQICVEPKDHEGDHKSATKVTAPNKKGA